MTTTLNRRAMMGMAAALPLSAAMPAKAADCPVESEADRRLHSDFAWLGRYADDNRALIASGVATGIVFMGDSITQGWKDKRPGFFTPGRVNRGIGGQTTPQMLLRMMADVIALRPRAVHIMGGTNDIAGNTGPMTEAMSRDTIAAMTTLARANGLRVLLASIPRPRIIHGGRVSIRARRSPRSMAGCAIMPLRPGWTGSIITRCSMTAPGA
jgi:hypothetical protein